MTDRRVWLRLDLRVSVFTLGLNCRRLALVLPLAMPLFLVFPVGGEIQISKLTCDA